MAAAALQHQNLHYKSPHCDQFNSPFYHEGPTLMKL
uniref:Uncharacterized protein n=1 Tax=Anguilla anguilla TaxID=7936 RepID=A0A0E9S2A6_ANGAN